MQPRRWRDIALVEGVLSEANLAEDRIVVWVSEGRREGYVHWERISNVPRAETTTKAGLCSTPASSIVVRKREGGILAKILPRIHRSRGDRSWTLPNGEIAEQSGDRRTDRMLVWAGDEAVVLDEATLRARLPDATSVRKIGENLFVVSGVVTKRAAPEVEPAATPVPPREEAERILAAGRQVGDRQREATALADLGIVLGKEGDAQGSLARLQEALAVARSIDDRVGEIDILGYVGLAMLQNGKPPQSILDVFEQQRSLAHQTGDRYAEKTALGHLGSAAAMLREPGKAIQLLERARAIAQELGDRTHQSKLLWQEAVQFAELGQSQEAIVRSEAAIGLMQSMGKPDSEWYAEHLRRYRSGETGLGLHEPSPAGTGSPQPPSPQGPSLLRIAASAAGAMAKFLGSGMKTTPSEIAKKRIETCRSCEHHTGIRCRLCGCFTDVKIHMLHESCPIGKWPG